MSRSRKLASILLTLAKSSSLLGLNNDVLVYIILVLYNFIFFQNMSGLSDIATRPVVHKSFCVLLCGRNK